MIENYPPKYAVGTTQQHAINMELTNWSNSRQNEAISIHPIRFSYMISMAQLLHRGKAPRLGICMKTPCTGPGQGERGWKGLYILCNKNCLLTQTVYSKCHKQWARSALYNL